ncbi:MAG: ABC transporter permease [Actinomycetota bacterium]|nr:ABC transporter permease [Actinomycetota bacterium]
MTRAAALLASNADSSPWHFLGYFRDHLHEDLRWLWDHAYLSVLPVVIGLVISLPLGWLARRYRWAYPPMISITGLLYTIPSIALFVIVPPLFGLKSLDPLQVPIALTVYSVALLVRVVADGLASVPEDVLQSATAMGFGNLRRLFSVELPIAVPVIAAGLRVATVSNVSLVAVAGTIGMDNLGRLFDQGIQLSTPTAYYPPIVLGIVLCVLLATAFDVAIVLANRVATPWRRAVVSR